MQIKPTQVNAITRIENHVQEDVGRNLARIFSTTKGNLLKAAHSIASTEDLTGKAPKIGLITGFYIEKAEQPETDGPLGAALLAFALSQIGIECRVITDQYCGDVCRKALDAAGANKVPLDIVGHSEESLQNAYTKWAQIGFTHVIATERPGQSKDGVAFNMRGEPIEHCVHFDHMFQIGPWDSIAIGDGGNEIGMGSVPHGLVAQDIEHGPEIACITMADTLIAAGVSNWGVNGLMGALAILKKDWKDAICSALTKSREETTLKTMIAAGAVDGITHQSDSFSVDKIPAARHFRKTANILAEIATYYRDDTALRRIKFGDKVNARVLAA